MGLFDAFRSKQPVNAASYIDGGNPASPENLKSRQADWQRRVLALANAIPEVAAAGSYINGVLDRVDFRVEGNVSPSTEAVINRGLESFRAGRVAENVFYVGEVVVGYKLNHDTNQFEWAEYAHGEYKIASNGAILTKDKKGGMTDDPSLKLFKVVRADRSDMTAAYSPHKAMLEMMEAWLNYQALDNRLAQNRLSLSGFLVMPAEDFPNIPYSPDGLPEPGSRQEFMVNLHDVVQANIKNPDPTNAALPLTVFLSEGGSKAFDHKLLDRVDDADAFMGRMNGYAQRYARGVDLPAEIVMGTGDANHWTAWKIDDDNWKYYLAPKANLIADELTENYAKPLADQLEGRNTNIRVIVDETPVVTKPDLTESAIKLHELGVITKEAAARTAGFDEDDIDEFGEPRPQNPLGNAPMSSDVRRSAPTLRSAAHDPQSILNAIAEDVAEVNHKLNERINKILLKFTKRVTKQIDDTPTVVTAASLDEVNEAFGVEVQSVMARFMMQRQRRILRRLGLATKGNIQKAEATVEQRSRLAASVAVRQVNDGVTVAANAGKAFVPNNALPGQLISISHGAPDVFNDEGATIDRPFDAGQDPLIQQPLQEAEITYRTVYTWVHGNPENPYEPHLALDGESWEAGDSEREAIGGETPFSGTGLFYPGDHKGCTCEFDVQFEAVEA